MPLSLYEKLLLIIIFKISISEIYLLHKLYYYTISTAFLKRVRLPNYIPFHVLTCSRTINFLELCIMYTIMFYYDRNQQQTYALFISSCEFEVAPVVV